MITYKYYFKNCYGSGRGSNPHSSDCISDAIAYLTRPLYIIYTIHYTKTRRSNNIHELHIMRNTISLTLSPTAHRIIQCFILLLRLFLVFLYRVVLSYRYRIYIFCLYTLYNYICLYIIMYPSLYITGNSINF